MNSPAVHPERVAAAAAVLGITPDRLTAMLSNEAASSPTNGKRYLPVAETEVYTGLSRWSLARATKDGLLPAIKLSRAKSGKVLYDVEDLDRFMRKLKTGGRAKS